MTKIASQTLNLTVLLFSVAMLLSWFFIFDRARLTDLPAPPRDWARSAGPQDLLVLPGYNILYWGKPNAPYGVNATRRKKKPRAVVVHFTAVKPVLDLVAYGHTRDRSRGGGSFGYHFYIGRGGGIAQGAPLSKRTNHIKSMGRPQRTEMAPKLWSGNTIGISLVGGCDPLLRPNWRRWSTCSGEYVTAAQLVAGLALIRAIQKRFGISCVEVYGHGELQTDRDQFEGATLTQMARSSCPNKAKNS